MQDELVWDLLLGELWKLLDQQVVLKLLCCSKSMMELVHSKCAGMLLLIVSAVHDSSSPPAVLTSWPQHHALGRWLAKHATLCSSIDMCITPESMPKVQDKAARGNQLAWAYSFIEAHLAAGLKAAASGLSSVPQPQFTRRQAAAALTLYPASGAAAPPATLAAAAAVQAAIALSSSSSSEARGGQTLLLTRYVSSMPCSGTVLPALASCKQLTSLQLQPGGGATAGADAKAGLAALTGLRELAFTSDPQQFAAGLDMVVALASALQLLTCLTRFDIDWVPSQHVVQLLPVSLVWLRFGNHAICASGLQLGRLTRVTELHMPNICSEDVLPPSLHILGGLVLRAGPLLQLQHLRQLQCPLREWQSFTVSGTVTELRMLTGLHQMTMACCPPYAYEVSEFRGLSTLPLKAMTVQSLRPKRDDGLPLVKSWCRYLLAGTVPVLGSCTQLTCLRLQELRLDLPVVGLVSQLRQLPALAELSLVRVHAHLVSLPPFWDPLWRVVPELASLRSFTAHDLELEGDGAASLAAASQLTWLELVRCGVSGAAEAELRAGLAQLSRSMLVVR